MQTEISLNNSSLLICELQAKTVQIKALVSHKSVSFLRNIETVDKLDETPGHLSVSENSLT